MRVFPSCLLSRTIRPTLENNRRLLARLAYGIVLSLSLGLSAPAVAQIPTPQFRIESQVYSGDSPTPVSENVTLFDTGIVYDFQMVGGVNKTPSEIVIFDERQRELILMDVERKIAWTVADLRLLKMVDQLRRETVNNAKASFLVNEPFVETDDWSSNKVSLESDSFRYVLTGKRPTNASILPRYYEFLDQFTRLGASDPKRLPPFPRLALNKTIKTHGWIPTQVQVQVKPNSFFQEAFSATSKHVLVMSLSDSDSERIKFARKCWMEFEQCDLVEYRQIPAASKRVAFKSKEEQTPSTTGQRR